MNKFYLSAAFVFAGLTTGFSQGKLNLKNLNVAKTKTPPSIGVEAKSTILINKGERGTAIWSDDFSNPANWQTFNSGNPSADWVIGTNGPSGAGGFPIDTINSTSRANGFAMFDSDGLGSSSSTQDATIATVNSVDLTGYPNVLLKFEQFYKNYQSVTTVHVSSDGGSTYTPFIVNSGLALNASTSNPDFISLDISSVAGNMSSVKIKFQFTGAWDYAWMVDDITIEEAPANDIALVKVYQSQYSQIPLGQQSVIPFSATIKNNGLTQTNVTFSVEGVGSSTPISSFGAGLTDSVFCNEGFNILSTGIHSFNFSLAQTETDASPADNLMTGEFEVTDNIYSRDNNSYNGSNYVWAGLEPYETGNSFYFNAAAKALSANVVLRLAKVGAPIRAKLYDISSGSLVLVDSSNVYNIQAINNPGMNGAGASINLPFINNLNLTDTGSYIVMIESMSSDTVVIAAGSNLNFHSPVAYLNYSGGLSYASKTPFVRLVLGDAVNQCANTSATIINIVNASCSNSMDGSMEAQASGTPPFAFAWSNGTSGMVADGLFPKAYSITITDANGCSASANDSITSPSPLTSTITTTIASCNMEDGTATIMVNGGTSPYSYAWVTGGSTSTTTGLAPNNSYVVNVVDANGCTHQNSAFINGEMAPGVPQDRKSLLVTDSTASMKWSAVTNALFYKIRYRAVGSTTWTYAQTKNTFKNITGLTPATMYEWQVRAFSNESCASGFSMPQTFMTEGGICPKPRFPKSTDITDNSAKLYWSHPAGVVPNHYRVKLRKSGEAWPTDAMVTTNKYFVAKNLDSNSTYYWCVRSACNSNGLPGSKWVYGSPFTTGSSGAKTLSLNEMDENELSSLNFYPNPASDVIYLSLETDKNIVISIHDVQGKVLIQRRDFSNEGEIISIDVKYLANGLYFIKTTSESGTSTEKILINR